jgi:hypothetical protein
MLQLFLIVDYICEWARDVYRPDIHRCLSGGDLDMPELGPGAISTSLQEHRLDPDPSFSNHRSTRVPTPGTSSSTDLSQNAEVDDSEMRDNNAGEGRAENHDMTSELALDSQLDDAEMRDGEAAEEPTELAVVMSKIVTSLRFCS